jgi:HSP20 family protein
MTIGYLSLPARRGQRRFWNQTQGCGCSPAAGGRCKTQQTLRKEDPEMSGLMRQNEARGMRSEIERMFDEFNSFWPSRREAREGRVGVWAPAVDIKETADSFVVSAELPGMNKQDIQVELENNTLSIKGERKFERKDEAENYHFVERSYGSFYRSFALPRNIKGEAISAEYKDGVLQVTLPKSEELKPKKVEIGG